MTPTDDATSSSSEPPQRRGARTEGPTRVFYLAWSLFIAGVWGMIPAKTLLYGIEAAHAQWSFFTLATAVIYPLFIGALVYGSSFMLSEITSEGRMDALPMSLEADLSLLQAQWQGSAAQLALEAALLGLFSLLLIVPVTYIWLLVPKTLGSSVLCGLTLLCWWRLIGRSQARQILSGWDHVRGVRLSSTGTSVEVVRWERGHKMQHTLPLHQLSVSLHQDGILLSSAERQLILTSADKQSCSRLATMLRERCAVAPLAGSPEDVPEQLRVMRDPSTS